MLKKNFNFFQKIKDKFSLMKNSINCRFDKKTFPSKICLYNLLLSNIFFDWLTFICIYFNGKDMKDMIALKE